MELIEFRHNEDVGAVVKTRDRTLAKRRSSKKKTKTQQPLKCTDGVFSSILLFLYSSIIKKIAKHVIMYCSSKSIINRRNQ